MKNISLIKQKILQYIDIKGVSKYQFYKKTGITRGVLDKEGGISEENISKFLAQFSEINLEWLILGEGEMIKSKPYQTKSETTEVAEPKPIYNNNVDTEKIAFYKEQVDFYKNAYHETKEKLTNCENEKKLQKTR